MTVYVNLSFLEPQLLTNILIPLDVVLLHALILTETTLLQACVKCKHKQMYHIIPTGEIRWYLTSP